MAKFFFCKLLDVHRWVIWKDIFRVRFKICLRCRKEELALGYKGGKDE
jgi:hypothetical protein